MSGQTGYSQLVEAGINTKVAAELCSTFATGKLCYEDLDQRAIDAIRQCSVKDVIKILNVYNSSTNLTHVKNKSAYLCGMIRNQREKKQQEAAAKKDKQKGGEPAYGQMNRTGSAQGPRGPTMGPHSGNQIPSLMNPMGPGMFNHPAQQPGLLGPGYNPQSQGNQGFVQPGNPPYGHPGNQQYGHPGNQMYGQPGNQQYGQPGNQQYGQPGNQQYGQPGNQQYGQPGNQQYGQPGNQQYGQPGNQQYGQPGNQQYGQPSNQQYGQPGNQQYGQPGNQQYGQPGNQQYGQPGNQQYGQPGNQQYGQPGNLQYGQPGNQQYGQPGNQPFGHPGNQGYIGQPGINQGFGRIGNQGPVQPGYQGFGQSDQNIQDKKKRQRRGKPKQSDNDLDNDNNDGIDDGIDEGFNRLKELLSEEPSSRASESQDISHGQRRDRGRGGRNQRGGRGMGHGGQRGQGQHSDAESHYSEDENEGSQYGSRGNLHKQGRERGRGNRRGGRGRGRAGHSGKGRESGQQPDGDGSPSGDEGSQYGSRRNLHQQGGERGRGNRRGGRGRRGQGGGQRKVSDSGATRMSSPEGSDDDNDISSNQETRGGRGNKGGQRRPKQQNKERQEIKDEDIPDVEDGEVFKFMIKTFSGGCTYEDFYKKCDLFPLDSNIPLWFRKHSRRFHIFWNPDSRNDIVYLQPFYRDAKVCIKYNNNKNPGMCDESCDYLHICRRFVRGSCKRKDCPLSHSFKTPHNTKLKHKLGLSDFTDVDIKIVLNCNTPSVCADYIYDNECKVPKSEKRCPRLHLCRNHVFNKCSEQCKFKKTHSIKQFHNRWVLNSCHMRDWPQSRVFKNIFVPPKPSLEIDDDTDDSDISQDEADDHGSNLYDSDLGNSSESLTSTASGHVGSISNLKSSFDNLAISGDVRSKKSAPPSRKNRFKSTDNIIAGIVGKDDVDLPTKETSPFDDDENIKERERLMIEEWKNDSKSKPSSDDISVKSKLPPKPLKLSPTDPKYQERDPVLLKDDSDGTNICFYLTKNTCKAGSCKSYHLRSEIPYLWQIKMFDKWMSFPLEENNQIEQAFCGLLDVVSTQIPYQRMKYSCHIYFVNQKAIIYNIELDGQTMSSDMAQGCVVRRLTTPSFAEKKMTVPCWLTQWRWYWSDDNRKWNIYDKDVFQFTLEKKFLTKQKSYLFSRDDFYFMYKIDFENFKQTNLDTNKTREIVRRPTFVSRDDVQKLKYPDSISHPTAMLTSKPMHFNTWDCAHDFELVEIGSSGKEYNDVVKSFQDTMDPNRFQIKYIYRIQNRKLWSEYDTKKRHMIADVEQEGLGKSVDERDLFHGTDSLNTCRGICTNNFDFRISGKNATLYGEGSYFGVRARTANSYTKADSPRGVRFLFRAKVLVGQFTKGDPSLKRPPNIPGKSYKLFDSCVDKESDPSIFVVFDRNQCYPDYLFMYTDNETLPPASTAATSHQDFVHIPSDLQSYSSSVDKLVYPQQPDRSSVSDPQSGAPSARPLKYKEAEPKKRDESCSIQ